MPPFDMTPPPDFDPDNESGIPWPPYLLNQMESARRKNTNNNNSNRRNNNNQRNSNNCNNNNSG